MLDRDVEGPQGAAEFRVLADFIGCLLEAGPGEHDEARLLNHSVANNGKAMSFKRRDVSRRLSRSEVWMKSLPDNLCR